MISAAIFDMDGLIVDSEPLWRKAEVAIFSSVGLHLSEEDCKETTGLRIDEVVKRRHIEQPWSTPPQSIVVDQIVDTVCDLVQRAQPKPGVADALTLCESLGLQLALASSSPTRLINATLRALGLAQSFSVRCSAEDERYGKPHPAVFLKAAKALGVEPQRCVVFEDSLVGVIAAKAASMRCIAVPETESLGDPRFTLADAVLPALTELTEFIVRGRVPSE